MTRILTHVAGLSLLAGPLFSQAPAPAAPIAEGVSLEVDVENAQNAAMQFLQEGKFKEALEKVAFIKSKLNRN